MCDIISREVTSSDLKDVVSKLIPDAMALDIQKACQGIYPLHDVHIRKVKVLRKPRLVINFPLNDQLCDTIDYLLPGLMLPSCWSCTERDRGKLRQPLTLPLARSWKDPKDTNHPFWRPSKLCCVISWRQYMILLNNGFCWDAGWLVEKIIFNSTLFPLTAKLSRTVGIFNLKLRYAALLCIKTNSL